MSVWDIFGMVSDVYARMRYPLQIAINGCEWWFEGRGIHFWPVGNGRRRQIHRDSIHFCWNFGFSNWTQMSNFLKRKYIHNQMWNKKCSSPSYWHANKMQDSSVLLPIWRPCLDVRVLFQKYLSWQPTQAICTVPGHKDITWGCSDKLARGCLVVHYIC